MCVPLPVPADPNENWPGFCFVSVINSATDLTPTPGATTSTYGTLRTSITNRGEREHCSHGRQ